MYEKGNKEKFFFNTLKNLYLFYLNNSYQKIENSIQIFFESSIFEFSKIFFEIKNIRNMNF